MLSARCFLELSSYRVAGYGLYRSPDKWFIIEPSWKRYSGEVPFRPRRRSRPRRNAAIRFCRAYVTTCRARRISPYFAASLFIVLSSACLVHDGRVTSASRLIGSSRDFAFPRSRAKFDVIRHQRLYIWILNIKWTFIDDNFVVNVSPVLVTLQMEVGLSFCIYTNFNSLYYFVLFLF